MVFDSAVEGFFLTHYDFLAKLEDSISLPAGSTGLQPLPDLLVRLSRAPVFDCIDPRTEPGVGSELARRTRTRAPEGNRGLISARPMTAETSPGRDRRHVLVFWWKARPVAFARGQCVRWPLAANEDRTVPRFQITQHKAIDLEGTACRALANNLPAFARLNHGPHGLTRLRVLQGIGSLKGGICQPTAGRGS